MAKKRWQMSPDERLEDAFPGMLLTIDAVKAKYMELDASYAAASAARDRLKAESDSLLQPMTDCIIWLGERGIKDF